MPDLSTFLTATLPALVSLVLSVLVYRRQARSDDAVGWEPQRKDGHIHLIRTGGGTAYDVDVTVGGGATRLDWGADHHDEVKPGARLWVGRFAPASSYEPAEEVGVTWNEKRAFGRSRNGSWSSHVA